MWNTIAIYKSTQRGDCRGIYQISLINRHIQLDSQLNSTQSKEDKEKLIESHRLKETALLRMRRRKLTIDCFQIIDVIGKGGFGKVFYQ